MLKGLDPDLAQYFVGPDLGPNCLQRLSADVTSRQIVNEDNSSKGPLPVVMGITVYRCL